MDPVMERYAQTKNWRVADGVIHMTKAQAAREQYLGRSLRDPSVRTLVVPGLRGSTLLFEGKHFVVE